MDLAIYKGTLRSFLGLLWITEVVVLSALMSAVRPAAQREDRITRRIAELKSKQFT
jgi:hypothetical protein